MASSTSINPPTHHETTPDRMKRKRKKKSQPQITTDDADVHRRRLARWKSPHQHQAYSSDLLHALSRLTLNAPARGGRAVRVVADRALAVAAKGRTRWSRAILTGGRVLKLSKFRKQRRPNRAAGKKSPAFDSRRAVNNAVRLKGKKKCLAGVHRKVRVLGRLIPGCRKEALPVVLEEATDYIAALEMQVRAMTVLANLLSGSTNIYNPSPT